MIEKNNIKNQIKLFSLLKLDFYLYGRQIFIALVVVNLIFIFNILISIFFNKIFLIQSFIHNSINLNIYLNICLFIGIIFSSNSFKHLHNEQKAIAFYMLPLSIFEKFLSVLLFYFLFYLLASIISTIFAFLINNIIFYIFSGKSFQLNAIFNLFNYKIILSYFFFCSIFMLGSTYFKKNSFFMTILIILAIFFIYSTISSIFFFSLFNNYSFKYIPDPFDLFLRFKISPEIYKNLLYILQFALSIFFYFISYLRLLEYDVKGEK